MERMAIPNLGNYTVALASAVGSLGIEAWASTATTPTAMKLGIEAAPESVCLPFKAHLGHFIEAAHNGVEYALMVNSVGTCRLRYYRSMVEQILEERNLPIRVFGLGYDGWKPPVIRYFNPGFVPFIKAVATALAKIKVIDIIELEAWRIRPRELSTGDATRVMTSCLRELDGINTKKQVGSYKQTILGRFGEIPIDDSVDPVRIGLIGEVSVLRDKLLNQNIEQLLGGMGVEVRNFFLLGAELGNIFHIEFGNKNTRKHLAQVARPYLDCSVGGHALDSVAHTITCAQQGYDGMVHLCPTGCMPEVSVRPILRKVSRDKDIPILQFSFDEHTSAVGVATRLEAFVDVLKERRRRKLGPASVFRGKERR